MTALKMNENASRIFMKYLGKGEMSSMSLFFLDSYHVSLQLARTNTPFPTVGPDGLKAFVVRLLARIKSSV